MTEINAPGAIIRRMAMHVLPGQSVRLVDSATSTERWAKVAANVTREDGSEVVSVLSFEGTTIKRRFPCDRLLDVRPIGAGQ